MNPVIIVVIVVLAVFLVPLKAYVVAVAVGARINLHCEPRKIFKILGLYFLITACFIGGLIMMITSA